MSWEAVRWPGFWNKANSASRSRTVMTQRAKLRRLAFIPCPYGPARRARALQGDAPAPWRLSVRPDDNVGTVTNPANGRRLLDTGILPRLAGARAADSALG